MSDFIALPTYQDMMLPLLQVLAARGELHQRDYAIAVADKLQLTSLQREALLPSGKQLTYYNRAGWAGWYLLQAGLVAKPKRGCLSITGEGRELLSKNPKKVDNDLLMNYPSFAQRILAPKVNQEEPSKSSNVERKTPDEQIAEAYQELQQSLIADLLQMVRAMDPFKFEQVVLDLVLAMGYGGSREEAGQLTQKSGDGGIDGIINEDRLGLDVIYLQAKRYAEDQVIGREKIQSFVGALAGRQAHKGIFIATCRFADTAMTYASAIPQKIVLIDGLRLAELMIEHNIGVSVKETLKLKRVDTDYFEEL